MNVEGIGEFRARILEPGKLEIERADPYILVSEAFLDNVRDADGRSAVIYGDGILTIKAINGTVSYGVGKPVMGMRAREAFRSPDALT